MKYVLIQNLKMYSRRLLEESLLTLMLKAALLYRQYLPWSVILNDTVHTLKRIRLETNPEN